MSTVIVPTDTPAVPPIVRTVAYFVLLVLAALVLLAVGLAPIWLPAEVSTKVVASGGVVTSVLGVIAGGLGVAYRPTAAANQPATILPGEVVDAADDDQDGTTEGAEGLSEDADAS